MPTHRVLLDAAAVTAAHTAAAQSLVLADATAAALTVTLPAVAEGAEVIVKKIDSSVNAVTVARAGAALIDGATSVALTLQWDRVHLVSDGVNWFRV